MKFPTKPPDTAQLLKAALALDADVFRQILAHRNPTDDAGRYLHWDDLRFKPPPKGLTSEEWWLATKLAREAASQQIGLADKSGAKFSFCEPPPLKALLRNLDMNAGGALASDATGLSAEEGRRYLARSLAEEPFASSLIEGAATTRQIAKKMILEGRAPRTKDERMVLNNYRAMQFVKEHKDTPLTLPLLLELHRLVTADTLDNPADAGRIREADDVRVEDTATNEVLFQPPPFAELPARLERLIAFANHTPESKNWIHPLLIAFILHFGLSYEHPFVDGNGRVARALFYWAALKAGYWLMEYISISSVIAEAPVQYGRAFLLTETDGGDISYFLLHQAETLDTALSRLMAYVERKRMEVAVFERRIGDKHRPDAFNHRQSWLLNEMARGRLASVMIEDFRARHGVSYLTARNDLEALVKARCLKRGKTGRVVVYRPVSDLTKILSGA
jgi:Fic family protein